jgi:hypothetical protein
LEGIPSTVSDPNQAAAGDGEVLGVVYARRGVEVDADGDDPVNDDEPEGSARTSW